MTKTYLQNTMQRIEQRTRDLLRPYARSLNESAVMRSDVLYNSSIDYGSYIYNNRIKHTTCLVSNFRCRHHHHVLIVITSDLNNFKRRQLIRTTWGQDPISEKQKWKTYFLVGRRKDNKLLHKLTLEMEEHKDIILGNTYEDFYNLAPKLKMAFEWSSKYCSFDFLLKGDDDVFINIPQLFTFVDDPHTPKRSLYAGNCYYAAVVGRDGRYGMSVKDYWKNVFPRYCSGGGFVLTRDVVEIFFRVEDTVPVIKIDDAYIGEVALRAGVDILHNSNFAMYESKYRCVFKEELIVHHPVKVGDCMSKLYERTVPRIIHLVVG